MDQYKLKWRRKFIFLPFNSSSDSIKGIGTKQGIKNRIGVILQIFWEKIVKIGKKLTINK